MSWWDLEGFLIRVWCLRVRQKRLKLVYVDGCLVLKNWAEQEIKITLGNYT